jgi:hypothetical protein
MTSGPSVPVILSSRGLPVIVACMPKQRTSLAVAPEGTASEAAATRVAATSEVVPFVLQAMHCVHRAQRGALGRVRRETGRIS